MSIIGKIKSLFKRNGNVDKAIAFMEAKAKELDEQQKIINDLYKEQGGGEPSDEVLELQISLNKERNKFDIPDKENMVNGWSQ